MSFSRIKSLKQTFISSPLNTPSVEIRFSGENFSYENNLSVSIEAEYANYEKDKMYYFPDAILSGENNFTKDYLQQNFSSNFQFLNIGMSQIFVRCRKTSSLGTIYLRFEFYYENPKNIADNQTSEYFAVATASLSSEVGQRLSSSAEIIDNSNVVIGKINFYYQNVSGDEINDISTGSYLDYLYNLDTSIQWNKATLLYQDIVQENSSSESGNGFVEDLFNWYPVETDGTIPTSINYWDFIKDLPVGTNSYYCLRIRLKDTNNNYTEYFGTKITSINGRYETNQITYFYPVFQYDRSVEFNPEYCTTDTPYFKLIVPTSENDYNNVSGFMNFVTHYRFSESISTIEDATWKPFASENGKTIFEFYISWLGGSGLGGEIIDGNKTMILQLTDNAGNISIIKRYPNPVEETDPNYLQYLWEKDSYREIYLYRQPPNSIVFNLMGSSGSEYYTGAYQDENGRFILTNKITINVFAKDNLNLPLQYKIFSGNNEESAVWRDFNYPDDTSTYQNIPFYLESNSNHGVFDNNYSVPMNLIFRNSAGVSSEKITKNIFYNTIIYKLAHNNLRPTSNSYTPVVEYKDVDKYIQILEKEKIDVVEPKRSWREVFYPETHGFPLNSNGNIDVEEAIKIVDGDKNYDAVKTEEFEESSSSEIIVKKKIVYDSEQRAITIWNDYGETKKYRALQSNNKIYNSETGELEGFSYWIIDSTGYSDFALEFEHFHLDSTSHVQENDLAPFQGDILVIYDASADGATKEYIDEYGKTSYKLMDSTKLKMLAAYTGDGIDVIKLYPTPSGSVNATANGGFTTDIFNTTSRLCLIFYSDGEGEKSGFKLKSSPVRETNWINWDLDERRGEIWIHKAVTEMDSEKQIKTLTSQAGYCPDNIRLSYDYSESSFDIDYENGIITFESEPIGELWGTYSYYNYDNQTGPYKLVDEVLQPITKKFAFGNDDLVEYREVGIYCAKNDENKEIVIDKSSIYNHEKEQEQFGKIVNDVTIYKDSGLIEFIGDYVPKNRLFSDYYCHTFYRLTDDGYGNLYFYDPVIVPDKTESYPDYTYVDLKVVNEGEANLKNGKIRFTYRGIATGNSNESTITSVLNPDRPWDVQIGTAAETFNQVGGVVSSNYDFPTMNWQNAQSIYNGTIDNGDTTLTGGKTEINFGIEIKQQQVLYLRVVWTMATGGTESNPSYITPSASGKKCFSGEIEGSFYSITI